MSQSQQRPQRKDRQLSFGKLGVILHQLTAEGTNATPHPSKNDPMPIKMAFADGVCGTIKLLGYNGRDLTEIIPRLLLDRLAHFTKPELALEREDFSDLFADVHPEANSMSYADFRETIQSLLPDDLIDNIPHDQTPGLDEMLDDTEEDDIAEPDLYTAPPRPQAPKRTAPAKAPKPQEVDLEAEEKRYDPNLKPSLLQHAQEAEPSMEAEVEQRVQESYRTIERNRTMSTLDIGDDF